jgi:hypothetical protein
MGEGNDNSSRYWGNSGTVLSFELGLLWPRFAMARAGQGRD